MVPQIGDEVVVSCEPASARVVAVDSRRIILEWPWGVIDHSSNFRWDGTFSFPGDNAHREWVPYRVEPTLSELRAGDVCTVSIPPTRLYVGHYKGETQGNADSKIAGSPVPRPQRDYPELTPPGFKKGMNRGHLLANRLGGSGTEPRNLVSLWATPNRSQMKRVENKVAAMVEAGQTVYYEVNALHRK